MRLNNHFFLLLFIFSFYFINNSYCTIYFLSNSGSDGNNGTSESAPWLTIDKLNSELSKLIAGDQVLFKCGDVFTGEISIPSSISGTKDNPIIFGSYGTGVKPIISGSIQVTNWEVHAPNIWKVPLNAVSVNQVFENKKRLIIARTPNKGYYQVANTNSNMSFTDSKLAMPINYWKNANIVYKQNEWLWVVTDIDSSTVDGFIHFKLANSMTDLVSGSGYFLQNKYELLDTINEWFFDASNKELYLYSTTNPSTKNIRASVYNNGIKSNWPWVLKYITIQDIEFNEHNVDEIQLFGADGFVVKRCNFYGAGEYSIRLNSDYVHFMRNCEISNNYIENSAMTGIFTWNVSQSLVSHNRIKNSGLYPVKGGAMSWDGCGINLLMGDSLTISYNKIDSSGNAGISTNINHSLIEKNIVNYSMLITSDGGAFYNNYGDYNIIRNNIFKNTIGNMEAAYPNAGRFTKELYFDMGEHHYNTIENNTMASLAGNAKNAGIGLALFTTNTTIRNNVIYNCWRSIELLNYDVSKPINTLDIRHNILYSNSEKGHPYWVNAWTELSLMFQVCDSNYLCNPYSDEIAEHIYTNNVFYYNFDQWKLKTNTDIHSKLSNSHWTYPTDSSFIIINETDSFARHTLSEEVIDLDHKPVSSIILPPFSSKVFIGKLSIKSTEYFTSDPSVITSFSENTENKFGLLIYPNPVNDLLNIIIERPNSSGFIEIIDINGYVVKRSKIRSDRLIINMLPYKDGIYILKTGSIAKKFIVQH